MIRTRHLGRLVLGAAAVVSFAVLVAIPPALSARSHLRQARRAFLRGVRSAQEFHFEQAKQSFALGGRMAGLAGSQLSSPLVYPAGLVPIAGSNLRALRSLARAAEHSAAPAQEAIAAMEEFPRGPSQSQLAMSRGRIDLAPWPRASQRLALAADGLRVALREVSQGGRFLVPALTRQRQRFIEEGGRALAGIERARDIAATVPVFFGGDRARTWFLAIQNPVELRATGGFLGAFGVLKAEAGQLRLDRLESNLSLPKIPEPPALTEEFASRYERFGAGRMWQNVNMTPDFPTAARLMTAMWEKGTGEHLDGVVAIDAAGLARLLEVVGPVVTPEAGEIRADNFLPLALNEAYVRFPDKAQRVDFLLPVGREVWHRIVSRESIDAKGLARALADAGAQKHLQIWVPELQGPLETLGLAGSLDSSPAEDHLLVVGQNAAGNKMDYYARRNITYRVEIDPIGTTQGLVSVRLDNQAPLAGLPRSIAGPYLPTDPPGLNRSYLSVYLPSGVSLLGARLDGNATEIESQREHGLAVVSRFVEVLPGRHASLDLFIRGSLTRPGEYRLAVQHQPGLHPDHFVLEIALPPHAVVLQANKGMQVSHHSIKWEGDLVTDQTFAVRYAT